MLDISDIGTSYTIMYHSSGDMKTINVVLYEELMQIIGEYDPNHFPNFDEYLEDVSTCIRKCVNDIHEVSWFTTYETSIDIYDAIALAASEDNSIVVIETIPKE